MDNITPIKRSNTGRFVKGQSGNPAGRSKDEYGVRDLARKHTHEAINTLAEIMNDKKVSASARASAACILLDRAWGKPTTVIENTQNSQTFQDWLDSVAAEENRRNKTDM